MRERQRSRLHRWRAAAVGGLALLAGPVLGAGDPEAVGLIYVLLYSGIACVKAPCPVWQAVEVASCKRVTADSIDTAVVSDPEYDQDWLQSWFTRNPLTVRGFAEPDPDSEAIVFKVLRILGGPDPRTANCPPHVWPE